MITNERQYRITKSEIRNFEKAISSFEAESVARSDVHPRLLQAEREALESQLQDLLDEVLEYEKLRDSQPLVISIDSFDDLANGLIKARIASGLTQRDLAERLNLKEQQIQRYESERYAGASLKRIQEIANAIGVRVRNDILLPVEPNGLDGVVRKLKQVGIGFNFLAERLLPSVEAAQLRGEFKNEDDQAATRRVAAVLEKIFGWSAQDLFGASPLSAPRFAAAEARFKIPAGRTRGGISLYAAYANFLAVVVLKGCRNLPLRTVPQNADELRKRIEERYGHVDLRSTLNYAWDLGIPVLPLKEEGAFHGACWRYDGRNAIVLKQSSPHEWRWAFDLLHELFHASQNAELETFEVIEEDETSSERRLSPEEIAASMYAGDVLLRGQSEQLAQACVEAARGSVERLKRVVPQIAEREGVAVGSLANYMAFRLSWQNINWWGAASNLQRTGANPWELARDVFLERFPFEFESDLDRQLLDRALH